MWTDYVCTWPPPLPLLPLIIYPPPPDIHPLPPYLSVSLTIDGTNPSASRKRGDGPARGHVGPDSICDCLQLNLGGIYRSTGEVQHAVHGGIGDLSCSKAVAHGRYPLTCMGFYIPLQIGATMACNPPEGPHPYPTPPTTPPATNGSSSSSGPPAWAPYVGVGVGVGGAVLLALAAFAFVVHRQMKRAAEGESQAKDRPPMDRWHDIAASSDSPAAERASSTAVTSAASRRPGASTAGGSRGQRHIPEVPTLPSNKDPGGRVSLWRSLLHLLGMDTSGGTGRNWGKRQRSYSIGDDLSAIAGRNRRATAAGGGATSAWGADNDRDSYLARAEAIGVALSRPVAAVIGGGAAGGERNLRPSPGFEITGSWPSASGQLQFPDRLPPLNGEIQPGTAGRSLAAGGSDRSGPTFLPMPPAPPSPAVPVQQRQKWASLLADEVAPPSSHPPHSAIVVEGTPQVGGAPRGFQQVTLIVEY